MLSTKHWSNWESRANMGPTRLGEDLAKTGWPILWRYSVLPQIDHLAQNLVSLSYG